MTNFLTDLWEQDRKVFWVFVISITVAYGLAIFILVAEFVFGYTIDPEWAAAKKQKEINEKVEYLCERFGGCP